MLRHDPEPLPAIGRISEGIGGSLQVSAGLRERGVARDESVLGVGGAGLDTACESHRELWLSDAEGRADHRRQVDGVVLGHPGVGGAFQPHKIRCRVLPLTECSASEC